ncbi:metallophosphoesterase family protein [Streptomyces sp. NPDC058086]|uniref:metallophosphoesterase family protein n=1 Tax=Streptomyces sp. NPDC058086 TaxID=3346334 RepID=UPI0036E54CC8
MRYRIVALAVVSVLAMAVPAGATTPRIAPAGAGPKPPGPTPPPGTTPPPGAPNGEAWAWTQLTSGGTQIRYVSTDTSQTCPVVRYTLGGTRNPFTLHRLSTPMGSQFPTTVCQRTVPLTASDAVLEQTSIQAATVHPANRQLPLPKWTSKTRPGKIAVIGDAGCEVPTTGPVQNCANHQTGWPFQGIADSAAGVTKPDLVVHTGDYLYREDPGRANDKAANPGCTTFADRASWDCVVADFFRPAEALLAAAPIALTRGNHEDCNAAQQGGAGGTWFRYLADDLRSNGSCSRYSAPSLIPAGTLTLASVDSSFADPNDSGSTAHRNIYAGQFQAVNQAALQNPTNDYFVVTHKPLWMVTGAGQPPNSAEWRTHVLDAAVADTPQHRLADNVRLVLSGHVHLYQMLDFNTSRPPQLTVGSSGGPLDKGPNDNNVVGQLIGTPLQAVHKSITAEANPPGGVGVFGYAVLEDNGGTWKLAFHDTAGSPVTGTSCTLSASKTNKSFACP